MHKIGFMQGRLIKSERKILSIFPWKNWKQEFYIAKNKIHLMEWTIDYFKFYQNPLIDERQLNIIKKLKKIII